MRHPPEANANQSVAIPDDSYARILGGDAWARVDPEVRKRFSVRPDIGKTIRYTGVMRVVRRSLAGALFAWCCRLIGTPLPMYAGRHVKTDIELTHDAVNKGICWTRRYHFATRELAVRSTKSVRDGRLEEYVGAGLSMLLRMSEFGGNLHFHSSGYQFRFGFLRIRLPSILAPGDMHIAHEQLGGDRFRFEMTVKHRWLGETFYQVGEFCSDG